MPTEHIEAHFLPLVRRLTTGDWFTNRVSACGLYYVAYEKVGQLMQEELRCNFKQLVEDDTPMVRRATGNNLKNFCEAVVKADANSEKEYKELLEIIHMLAIRDEQDSVRCLTVPSIAVIVENSKLQDVNTSLFNWFNDLVHDKSWRVRQKVAKNFAHIQEVFLKAFPNNSDVEQELLSGLQLLFKDIEGDVRVSITESLGKICANISKYCPKTAADTIKHELLDTIKTLVNDPYPQVKEAIGKVEGKVRAEEFLDF